MAEISPFRGVRYNVEKVPDLGKVVIPPYDVISPQEQKLFDETSPYNMIHLELGPSSPDDTDENNPYTRASGYLQEWQTEKVLIRDDQPAIYYYELCYSLSPQLRQTRRGFICALRLEDFSAGAVRPHEKTFQAVKDERLRLMLACHANLSPVFALYSDPAQLVDHSLRSGREADPIICFLDRYGMEHKIWRVRNLTVLRQVRALMQDKAIFIADGHHRYETALNYRSIQRERHKDAGPRAPFEYIMIYLSNLNHGGLTILPTHRLLRNMDSWDPGFLPKKASAFFDVSDYQASEKGESEWRAGIEAGKSGNKTVIGIYCRGARSFHLLRAKREAVASYLASRGIPDALHGLDVVVLDEIILKHLLSLPEAFLANENNIHFKRDLVEGLLEVQSGQFEVGFFINPTRIEQVQEVANAGLIMPHKSTYFYPKVGSGMVLNPLPPGEEVIW